MRLDIKCQHRFSDHFEINIDLACEVRAMAIFGPSGSGKTTMLSTIAGTFSPSIGKVFLDDQTLLDTENRSCLPSEKRSIGVTPQHSMLFEHMNVCKNLEYGMPKNRKWKRKSSIICKREIKFDEVVEILELGKLLERYPANLSGGEQRRIAIGRALLSQPRMLILDEPLSALDENLRLKILVYLKRVIENWHLPTIIITHSKAVVHALADNVIIIDNGHIIGIGSPTRVLPAERNSCSFYGNELNQQLSQQATT